jgi:cytochrome d ubiquinol oxidase subunit II
MTHEMLCLIWFILLGVLLGGYAVLDGFDLGVGILHPLARTDRERRIMMNSIGPLWDGNEVWLITFGGALFAAFPFAYHTIFSGFYLAFMLLLFALVFRAVSMEFRSKQQNPLWRRFWDWCFFGASFTATLLFGVAAGNGMLGVALNERGVMTEGLLSLLNPYSILVGLFTVSMFAMHGAIYLNLKTEGELRERLGQWMWHTWGLFLVLYILTTMYTLVKIPRATANFEHMPWAGAVVVLNVLAIANIPRAIFTGKPAQAFLSSCLGILCFVFLFAVALFPNIVTGANGTPSITIYNAASSPRTLTIMLIIAALGMPFVLAYTAVIYWTFRGKVQLGDHSY